MRIERARKGRDKERDALSHVALASLARRSSSLLHLTGGEASRVVKRSRAGDGRNNFSRTAIAGDAGYVKGVH